MFFFTESLSPQARGTYYVADAERCRRTGAQRYRRAAPQARRSHQEAARGTSEAMVKSAHLQGRVTDVLMRGPVGSEHAALATLAALASLVSSVLIFALPNFHSYYCLLDFASGGLWGPNRVTDHLKATSL